MLILILGLVIFLGVHSVRIVADEWRDSMIAKLGEKSWKIAYAIVSAIGFVLIVYGFGRARLDPTELWRAPLWLHHVAGLLVAISFILIVAAYVPGTRIKAAIGHPMVAGVKVWAFAHLLVNGMLSDLVLFGSFLVWAIFDFTSARKRDRLAGRQYTSGPAWRDAITVVIGLVAWGVFAHWLHGPLIGVAPRL